MAKQFKVAVNNGKESDKSVLDVPAKAGAKGQPLRIKATPGTKYQLQEISDNPKADNKVVAPDFVKTRRLGKDLLIILEGSTEADIIIEDYYNVFTDGYNGLIGQAENGSFYEYIPEDPNTDGMVPNLRDGAQAVNAALGGSEVQGAGAAVGLLAVNPLLGALGVLGAGAAAVAAANTGTTTTATSTPTGKLTPTAPNDSGVLGDNKTNDKTPTLNGTVPAGSSASVTLNGQTYPVTVATDGSWTFTQPTDLPDGTYTPQLNVTTSGVTTTTPITPFTIDTVTKVDITNPGKVGGTDPISGTSEPGDTVVVKDASGKVLGTATADDKGNWSLTPTSALSAGPITATATDAAGNTATDTDTPISPSVKTALTIDPITGDNIITATEAGATTYTVTGKVTGKFAAGDLVSLSLNGKTYATTVTADGSYSLPVSMADLKADPDTKIEGTLTGTGGDTATAAQDYTVEASNTPTQTALSINPVTPDNILNTTEASATVPITGKVTGPFSPNDTVSIVVNGKTYTGKPATDGTFSIPVPGSELVADPDTTVEASITGTGGTTAKAVQDYGVDSTTPAPSSLSLVNDTATIGEAGGIGNATNGAALTSTTNGVSVLNVLANDLGNTPKVTAVQVVGAASATAVTAGTTSSTGTRITGQYGSLVMGADGSYSYTLDNANGTVQALRTSSQSLSEVFTYTANDGTGAKTANLVVTITGTNDAPTVLVQEADKTANVGTALTPFSVAANFADVDSAANAETATLSATLADGSALPSWLTFVANTGTFSGTPNNAGTTSVKVTRTDAAGANVSDIFDIVVTAAPSSKTALTIDPITGDNIITATEAGASTYTVTGKATGKFSTGDLVSLSLNGKTYTGLVTADGSYSIPVAMADLKADPDTKIEGTLTGTGGDTATAAQDYTVEATNTPTQTALALNPVTADNILNTTEAGAAVPITGKVTGPFSPNDTVSIVVNGKTYTGKPAPDGSFSIPVPGSELVADPDTTVEASITGTGGTPAKAVQDYGIDSTTPTPSSLSLVNDTATAIESGFNITGSNPAGNVLANDTANSVTAIAYNGNIGNLGSALNGAYGTLTLASNGSYSYTLNNSHATVNALPAGNTLTEVFTYTATDGISSKTANLTITITGTNDAPVAVADTASALEASGTTNGTAGSNPTGNLLTNDTDVDLGDTKTVMDIKAGSGTAVTVGIATNVVGSYGTLVINTDGSYTYNVSQSNPTVQALLPSSAALTDTFTYTVKDFSGASSTATLTVSVSGANDAPTYTTSGLTDQTLKAETPLTYQFAGNTGTSTDVFKDVDTGHQTGLTYAATLSNGNSLPSWLAFNAATRTFTGTPPEGTTSPISVKVTATDSLGLSTSGSFNIVVTAAPSSKTALTIDPITGDNIITATEAGASTYTVTGKVTGKFAAGDLVNLSLNGKTYAGLVTADGSYSIPVSMADLKADPDTKIEGTLTGTGGDTATAAQDYTVEATNTPTQTALSINPVTPDNILNTTEASATVPITGKVTGPFSPNDTVSIVVNGKTYTGKPAPDGSFSIPVPGSELVADPDTTVEASITGTGGTPAKAVQDYGLNTDGGTNPVDTTPPTIAITSNQASLATGQQATITFTLSEASTDFVWNGTTGDINVTGGTLSALKQDPLNPRIYTAVFTPATNSTTNATISVASDKFSDAAGNFNKDGADADNTVTLSVNTTTIAPALVLTNDAKTVAEEGINVAATTASGNVLSNDTGNSPKVTGIQTLNATTTTTVSANGTTVAGQFGTLAIADNGTYTYTVNNASANVQALRTSSQSLSDVFTYTANDGTGAKTANLVVTITGTNDAPILTTAVADRTGTVGTALPAFSVASNFDDIDSAANGETATLTTNTLPSWLKFDAVTGTFSGTPTAAGTTSVTVTRTDAMGANVSDTFDIVVTTTGTASGQLAPSSDSGVTGDNKTNDKTPALEGTAPKGTTAVITIAGKDYPVTVNPDGSWTLPATDELPDGIYTPILKVTPAGDGTPVSTNLTPFTIDTVPPTVKVEAASKVLAANTTTVITFTLSEAAFDFTKDDIIVSGGAITDPVKSSTNPLVYTAIFTPTANTTSATIGVDSDRFSDAAANFNKDSFRLTGDENANNQVTLATNSTSTGQLAPASDSGTKGDNKTNDDTPALTGTAPTGSTAVVTIAGKDYPVTVKSDGSWELPATDKLPDGIYTPILKVTPAGGGTPVSTNLTPFTIDTVAPTVKVEAASKVLAANTTTVITFTLSEEATDFTKDDVVVTGGAISDPVKSSTNPLVYTATFTPTANTTSATIGVDSDRFSDAAANFNKDSFRLTGDENTNNQVTLATNSASTGQLSPSSDTGVPGDNLTNDKTPALEGKAPTGSTAVVNIGGKDYPVTVKPDGTWTLPATDELPDGIYTPILKVTPAGGGTPVSTNLTPFTIDTVPPTVKVEAASTTLLPNRGTTVTFTLSEASSDFTKDDIIVSGGAITDPVKSSTNPLVYTAIFTPTATGTSATIGVDSERFADAAGNRNQDSFRLTGAENANNQVTLVTNFTSTGQLSPDSDTGTKGDNLTKDDTPSLSGKVPPGSTATVTVNGKPYPATVNPDGTWTAQIPDTDKLPDGTYTPILSVTPAGGGTPVETTLTPFTIDTTPPTVSIAADSTVLTSGKTAMVTFTLSEATTDFTKDDVVVTGGAITDPVKSSTNPLVYTATFTPTSTATNATISIASDKFSDAAANFNKDTGTNPAPTGATFEANNLLTLATNAAPADTTPPTVIVTRNGTGTLTSSETITFTLSEPSKDFTINDLSTNTGSFSNFTAVPTSGTAATGHTQYTVTYTPVVGSSGQATIGVRAGRFSDAAGNQNKDTFQIGASGEVLEDNNKVDISYNTITPAPDTTPPTVIVSRAGTSTLTQGGSDTITFTLSENSLTFVQTDVTVNGGTLSNWTQVASSGSPSTGYHLYTATFTPTPNSSGTATIGVKASTFKDLAGNNNQDTFEPNLASTTFETNNQVSIGFNTNATDTTPPSVAVVRSNTGTITGPETILFNFSEAIAPSSFVTDDITISGGTISNLVAVPGSGNQQFSATFTPTPGATGTATIGVLAGKFTDTSNNANIDTFEAGNANYEANNHVSAAYDTSAPAPADKTAPTVSITRTGSGTIGTGPGVAGATETIVFTFSEAINPASFTTDDITVTSGTLSNLAAVSGSGNTQFTATYTPDSTRQDPASVGTATISIASDKFTDVAGNANKDTHLPGIAGTVQESNNQISIGFNTDTTAPTIAITRATTGTVTGTETITFTLSEASTNFSKSDIDINGTGSLGDLIADTTSGNANTGYTRYTAVFTPVANSAGDTQIGVKNGTFSDLVGNTNKDTYISGVTGTTQEANNQVSLSFNTHPVDRTPPTVSVARSGTGTLTGATANETITFTLSEASTNFGQSDITVSGGTLSNFAAVTTSGTAGTGYTQYTATFTPTGTTGTGTVGVKSGQFTDNAGNTNLDTFEANQAGTVQEANNQVSIPFNKTGNDTTPPTIVVERIGTGTLTSGQTETLLFTTSEVANLDESRITVIKGGTLTNLTPVASSGSIANGFTQWTATFTPTPGSSGQAQIGVLNGKVDDTSGNFNLDTYQTGVPGTVFESNNLVSFNYDTTLADTTPPTIALSRSGTGTVKTGETIYFTLSEPSKNFAIDDIDVQGGSLSGFTAVPSSGNNTNGHTQYTAIFLPDSGKGVAVIGVKAGKFSDAALNLNTDTSDPSSPNYQANNQVFLNFDTNSTDTTPPTVAVIRSTSKVLGFGETEVITFVLSEPSLDFAVDDVQFEGGNLTDFAQVNSSGTGTNGYTQYTALFTPETSQAGVASIGVVHGKFKDAANNLNQDTYLTPATGSTQVQEGNNQVKIVYNTVPAAGPTANADTAAATEAGSIADQDTSGISPTGNVLTNDTVVTGTKMVQSIRTGEGNTLGTAQNVAANSTQSSNATQIKGQFGTLTIGADGSYNYAVDNANPTVQALLPSSTALTDTFTYTVNDGTSATASTTLKVAVRGANDRPELDQGLIESTTATIGTDFNYTFGTDAFKDPDTGDTLTYSASLTGGASLPTWLKFDGDTRTFSGNPPTGTTAQQITLVVTAKDTAQNTVTDTFVINISNNNAPTLADIAAPAAIAELADAKAQNIAAITGDLTVNDKDSGNAVTASTTQANVVWSGGTLPSSADVSELIKSSALTFGTSVTPNNAPKTIAWTYDPAAANLDWLAAGQTLTITYPVTVSDGQGGTAVKNLVITITGTNDAPVAADITKSYNKGVASETFNLVGSATDLDQGETASLSVDSATAVTYSVNGAAATSTVPAGVTFSNGQLTIDPTNVAFKDLTSSQSIVIVANYKIKDSQGATTAQTATLTVKGSGSGDPTAQNDTGSITEKGGIANNTGANFKLNNNLLSNDSAFGGATLVVDTIKAGTGAGTGTNVPSTDEVNITGKFGTLSVQQSGGNAYTLDNSNAEVEALQVGETLTDTFTYTIKDSTGKTSTATLTMTINGANDAPVAVADTITVGEAGGTANNIASTAPTTGKLLSNDTDVDKNDTLSVTAIRAGTGTDQIVTSTGSKQINGTHGALTLQADGNYSYTVDNNKTAVQQLKNAQDTLTDTFTYTVTDAKGLSSTATLTVTITGANDAPVVTNTSTAPTSATNLTAFNFGTAFSLADVDVGTGLMTLTLSSDATDGRLTVNLGSTGATLTNGGNGTTNSAVISGTLAQLQALTANASSFSFVDTASQAAARDITITALLNDQGNDGTGTGALTDSKSIKVSLAADPNKDATIDITAITEDTGRFANDYITNDNKLVFMGTVAKFNASTARVKLELVDANNTTVATETVSVTATGSGNGTWTWTDPIGSTTTGRGDGTYKLVATIVDLSGNRISPNSTVGSNTGTRDEQNIVIDTNTPNTSNENATIDIVTIDDGLSTTTASTGSKDTGNANDFITSDRTLIYKGTVSGWVSNGSDLVKLELKNSSGQVVGTQYVNPVLRTGTTTADWSWDHTATTLDANATYTLQATIVDLAGNRVNAKEPVNGTNGGTDSQLIVIDATAPTQTVTFSSMTKDTGTISDTNANWITSDSSAGRLVSGTIDATLKAGEVVKVYANGMEIGVAVVNGKAWAITDTKGYGTDASWTYTAKVVNAAGTPGKETAITVTTDYAEAPPIITGAFDTSNTSIADGGTAANVITKVSGTAAANSMIYLYNNTSTNLIGTTMADGGGSWSITGLNETAATNQFAAKQLDINGNLSAFSNVWDVNSTGNGLLNGDFSKDLTGFTSDVTLVNQTMPSEYERMNFIRGGNRWSVIDLELGKGGDLRNGGPGSANWDTSVYPTVGTLTQSSPVSWTNGTWSQKIYVAHDINAQETTAWGTFASLASGKILGGSADYIVASGTGNPSSAANPGHLWASQVSVVSGQTYAFNFTYWNTLAKNTVTAGFMDVVIDGKVAMTTTNSSAGIVTITYVATKTGIIDLSLDTWSNTLSADYAIDNMTFNLASAPNGTLAAGGTPPATPQPDTLTYNGGALDAMASNDQITVTKTDLQSLLNNGGYINGGAGIDTLKLAPGTTLNLDGLTSNQTVQHIQQIEVFQLQGSSSLTLTANDVLALGGSNASTMVPYTFSSTSGGTASANSMGKVQFVVNGTNTDTVTLENLVNDGVTTNSTLGNTGLAGAWSYMGTTQVGSSVYRVYNHSTTEAQVLVASAQVVTPTNPQSILITRADSNNVSGTYAEEFGVSGTTPVNTFTSTIDTSAWTITAQDLLSAKTLVPELKLTTGSASPTYAAYVDTAIGTDAKLVIGPNTGAGDSNEPRLNTFTSKAGAFTAIGFNYLELNYSYTQSVNGGSLIKFYNADGVVIHETVFTVPGTTGLSSLGTYNYTLPVGMSAASFSVQTNTNDQWFMDGLTMTPVASTYLPHTGSTVDPTPLLSGTYASNLNPGDVIKIYDATGSNYLGDATVDPATKTWTYQLTSPQAIGADTYQAKIVNATTNVATSNNYTLNVLASSLNITSISVDSGTAGDFITNDNTLTYNGALPKTLATGEKVLVQIYDTTGTNVLRTTTVTPAAGSTTWTWTDTGASLADGNYIIKATIVDSGGVNPVAAYGINGVDTQPMTIDANAPTQIVSFSSMTKDSSSAATTADWTTSDSSAGRLISGTLSAPLNAGESLEVYANGSLIGTATVAAGGKTWVITDPNGYGTNVSWTYTAKVVDVVNSGTVTTQVVTADYVESAPIITGVFDTASTNSIANNSSTSNLLSKVSGTASAGSAAAGSTIYLYDNLYNNLVGTTTVDANGNWSVTTLKGTYGGSNTFAAVQLDVNGNQSVSSNLWTVTAPAANLMTNGSFSAGNTGFTSDLRNDSPTTYPLTGKANEYSLGNWASNLAKTATSTTQAPTDYAFGTWSKQYTGGVNQPGNIFNPDGAMDSVVMHGQIINSTQTVIWKNSVQVEAGKTYTFKMDYINWVFEDTVIPGTTIISQTGQQLAITVDGQFIQFVTNRFESGHLNVTYTATSSKAIDLSITAKTGGTDSNGDFWLDNLSFQPVTPTNELSAGVNWGGPTPRPDDLVYTQGGLDALASNDTITVRSTDLQKVLTTGGYINGGTGVDTLKMAAGTSLNLVPLTSNQTVQPIQQVEIFQLQGSSTLTLSANDVLSLGGSNATTMSAYSFGSTSGGAASASSTGKVQFVVNALNTDTVNLSTLTTDGKTTNGVLGNTGLAGSWTDMGTTTIGGVTYKVFNHSTTEAQVLVSSTATVNTTNHAPIMTDTDSLLPNPMGILLSAGSTLNATFVDSATVDITRTSSTGTLSYHNGEVAYNSNGKTRINLATYEAAYSENISYVFTTPEAGVNINFEDFTPGDTMQVKINGQLMTLTTAMQGGTSSVAMPDAAGTTLVGTARNVGSLGLNQFTLTILPSDVPGGLINSIEILGNSDSSGGGFWMYAPTTAGDAYTIKSVAQLFGGVYYDQDSHVMKGVAITSAGVNTDLSTKGAYSYSTDGGVTWKTLAAGLSDTQAIFLSSTDLVRYVPVASNTGSSKQDLTARVVDTSGETGSANLISGNSVDVSVNGGSTAYSVKTITLSAATLAPVVLDLNGDAVMSYTQIQMDMNADGVLDTTAWTGAQDGVLVHDSFGDGSVRSTAQFAFARHSGETDLQGLAAQFDSNHDGVLDTKDGQFAEFAVWQDVNQNGVADAGEVKHLADLGISAIGLHSDGVVRSPAVGVTEAGHSAAQLINGTQMLVSDAAFAYTPGTNVADKTATVPTAPVQAPTHCDEPWTSPAEAQAHVFKLDTTEWQNKPYALSAEQLAELKLPVPTSDQTSDAMQFMLKAGDVLLHSLDATTAQHAVQSGSDSLLNLSNLLGTEASTAFAQQCITTLGHQPDASLQMLIDMQHTV